MAKTITLANVEFSTSKATVSIGGAAYTDVTVDGTGKKVIVGGYGTFDASSADAVVFTADASLNGEVELVAASVNGSAAKLTVADFSKAAGITYTGGADVASITGGAGNDYVKIDGTTGVAASVTLGAGADTLEFADTATKNVTLADYNYYQGDVIKVTEAATPVVPSIFT